MSPTSYQTAPPRVTCRSSGVYYHSIGPSLCQSFFAKDTQFFCSGRQAARSLISPLQTPAVCGKIPPFPAPRRKRARTARPPVPCQESRLPGCEGGHGPRRAPVSALPRPIPDGPPPISGANKGENAFSRSDRPLPGRFGGPAGPPSCNRIARLCPVVQTSRRALTAPAARFTPHLRVALDLRPNSPQG